MMTGSTGGERSLAATLATFEGLVYSTARMYAPQLHVEEDDLAQELRVKVWHAATRYDPSRSSLSIERYVFGALTNRIKDLKRGVAREAKRRRDFGVSFLHIEEMTLHFREGGHNAVRERFDALYNFATHDEVYAEVEREPFEIPAGVTRDERDVLALLTAGFSRAEIALTLGVSKFRVDEHVRSLRRKFGDWQPSHEPELDSDALADIEGVPASLVA